MDVREGQAVGAPLATTGELAALVDRLRKASGPCRVLDGMVFRALEGRVGDDWVREDGVWLRRDPQDRVAFDIPPPFTRSVDAVLAAVPGDWHTVKSWREGKVSHACIEPRGPGYARCHRATAPTQAMALSLCAVAALFMLRAHGEPEPVPVPAASPRGKVHLAMRHRLTDEGEWEDVVRVFDDADLAGLHVLELEAGEAARCAPHEPEATFSVKEMDLFALSDAA